MSVPQIILELVERFERQLDAYTSGHYNETQLRREFLDPFFKALGWDIDNEHGYAEAYKDVIHEDAIRIGDGTKAPDYCFRIGGTRKFFLEAKKPAVDIKHDVSPAFQLRRYAWTTKLPLSILSNFEEFAVYDCRVKPDQRDSAATACILYIPCTEYATRWDEIAGVFSREAVLKGSFDKYAQSNKAKRGTADVDDEFLKTIEGWRADLAHNLALRNPKLTQRELNFAVQRIIDRVIFLRICEGRGIEDYGRLQALTNGDRIYPRLAQQFQQADDRYNSGLFHFKPEKGRQEAPDELTLRLDLDDKLLRDILKSLYYPECPYVFSALPADILGQVYEQFLGKVIRLTEGHRAVVEEKPEVKKAGGVYYTPTYIVEYIVQNTVGKLLEAAAGSADFSPLQLPNGVEAGTKPDATDTFAVKRPEGRAPSPTTILKRISKLRILDPACGSGSFLLGAYEYLLNWHLDFYAKNDPTKWAKGSRPVLVQTSAGWRLTIAERKRILLDNIYGVDIDTQAVETTKLSLLLKVLEGETQQSLQPVLRMFQERALPDLANNIKCGNSLIGPDFYQQQQMTLLDDEGRYRINVFDWHAEFPHIFRRKSSTSELRETAAASPLDYDMPGVPLHGTYSYKKKKAERTAPLPASFESEWEGGFDAVIGNPPYIRIQRISHAESDYVFRAYQSPTSKMDLSLVFMEQAIRLSKKAGRVGFICTSQWLSADYGRNLRRMLSNGRLHHIVDFGSLPVFQGANTYPAIFILSPTETSVLQYKRITSKDRLNLAAVEAEPTTSIPLKSLSAEPWTFGGLDLVSILERGKLPWKPLRDFGKAYIGCKTGMNEAFVLPRREANRLHLEKGILFPYAYRGEEVTRYCEVEPEAVVIYPYREGNDGQPEILAETELRSKFPNVHAYLSGFKGELRKRQDSRRLYATGPDWYRHLRPGSFHYIRKPKLAFKGIAIGACVGSLGENTAFDGARCPSLIIEDLQGHSLRYAHGILNSKVATSYFRINCPPKLSGYIEFAARVFSNVPVRVLDLSNKSDKAAHERMVNLVEQMVAMHVQLAAARTPQEQTSLERQIAATDTQIDRLVFDLYGLTDDEIRIVESEG